ncbi:hypothetical protein VTN77DRAFT_5677 [Rasamsonia byssochlamydoides]|uniref:uncharacterized protein n=1 Tax=Rasamsonia byssochlamydoides TaxID=89139 RepID=UPI003743970A
MLITPRTYILSQTPDRGVQSYNDCYPRYHSLTGWRADIVETRRAVEMLLVHQAGYVRVGEVVRYTLTYTPAVDPILPTPAALHVKVKNTSAIPLRAAYLHGPYTLYTACYPSTFDPNHRYDRGELEGEPQFEPNLKAGGAWTATIPVPEQIRLTSQSVSSDTESHEAGRSVTWVIEIVSQVIFSTTAAVHFELLVGRDQKSLDLGLNGGSSVSGLPPPAHIHDHQMPGRRGDRALPVLATKGVFSKSVKLVVEDTKSLWSTPPFPSLEEKERLRNEALQNAKNCQDPHGPHDCQGVSNDDTMKMEDGAKKQQKKKRIHFVVLTHGLHSNLGADMLYLKESIDAAARMARKQAREHRNKNKGQENGKDSFHSERYGQKDTSSSAAASSHSTSPRDGTQFSIERESVDDDEEEEYEEVIVRGFPGNAVRTERGIQYLGKRLAKYVLLMTYPDQPYLPVKRSKSKKTLSQSLTGPRGSSESALAAYLSENVALRQKQLNDRDYAYQITSISFIGHSLGGLVQTYAIAYIQKHSPEFFERIKPINFVALATPFLGLSNENPIYVRFALDFGLVGRTGQDLGLSWTAPRIRTGWSAMIGGIRNDSQKPQKRSTAASKPLLRILPTGPAHQVLLKFRNRTIYSNVVNDGIVPLRTSCLLFLDWRGLDRVEKARRENGLVGTMAEWGWAELTGANSTSPGVSRPGPYTSVRASENNIKDTGSDITQERSEANDESYDGSSTASPTQHQFFKKPVQTEPSEIAPIDDSESRSKQNSSSPGASPFSHFWSIFHSKDFWSSSKKQTKIYKQSQTLGSSGDSSAVSSPDTPPRGVVRGDSLYEEDVLNAPPKTTIFESAGDVLRPPLPPTEFIIDPASRPRTIFHDRVYHPEDIPPPSVKRRTTVFSTPRNPFRSGSKSLTDLNEASGHSSQSMESSGSGMKVEEKIARAYHHNLSWRKVLVRLEPDAHNNIIVRRMFANAYGWPVIKHLVDTHFGYNLAAETDDAVEPNMDRAKPLNVKATDSGEEVVGQACSPQASFLGFSEQKDDNLQGSSNADIPGHGISASHICGGVPVATAEDVSANEALGSPLSGSSGKWSDRYFYDDYPQSESESDHDGHSV